MGWVRFNRGTGSNSNLKPFPTCGKGPIYEQDKRKRCSKWVSAQHRPDLWGPERIAKACAGCPFYKPEGGGGGQSSLHVLDKNVSVSECVFRLMKPKGRNSCSFQ